MIETNVQETVNIDENAIHEMIKANSAPSLIQVRSILAKAAKMKGLEAEEATVLMSIENPELLDELFRTAKELKETIYGKRLVMFAPLYVANLCANECTYCAFRVKNKDLIRRVLSQDEIAQETKALIDQGHKRVLLVAGESYPQEGFQYILDAIDTIYATKNGPGEIRRVNVNVAPLDIDEFRQLKDRGIGTYQIFQETYHRDTYKKVHIAGRKKYYDWRITALDRAIEAGIDDVGIGVLFGLYDWKFEILAMLEHVRHLEEKFGVGPHTISVPRMEPATGSDIASQPPYPVSDLDFKKIVAILRLTVPYTGIIMSTRETAEMRRETFELGISQISAGSRTNPGGYEEIEFDASQFSLGDHRSLDEVIKDVAEKGYVPSFCTGCYRLGRTGADFMDLAKPGDIKAHCDPNGLSTFQEYLEDYASEETRAAGEKTVQQTINEMDTDFKKRAEKMVDLVKQGKRDVYC
jgi:2-iminoacetate synthase